MTDATWEFASGRLRWCLEQPLVYGGQDWAARVARALEQVSEAFERHVASLEGRDGPLAQIADPDHLPFSEEARAIASLRERQQALRNQIRAVGVQFEDALLLFPPRIESDSPPHALAAARAFRLFGILGSCARDLLDALEGYRAAEKRLLLGAQPSTTASP
jgi:hypothetical protein